MNDFKVAIDGPAGSGKSTISRSVAERLGFIHIDTGAMYRAVTLEALNRGIDLQDESAYTFIDHIVVIYEDDHIYLNGKDVSQQIRESQVTDNVSLVSKFRVVREKMLDLQRKSAEDGNIVMDGRDIGYNVLPDADLKIFLTATVEERAARRQKENQKKGVNEPLSKIRADINERDYKDSNRDISPLKKAADAITVDTTSMSPKQVIAHIVALIEERMKENG